MRSEQLFRGDERIAAEIDAAQVEVARINAIPGENAEGRRAALEGFLAGFGAGSVIRPPFYCDLGDGITIGERTFINSTCTMLDTGLITVGSECHIATGVHLITATHPIDPVARRDGWEIAHPVRISDGVWLGAGVIVCPGVEIGENTVVGAGAVVTRSLPPNVVAYGNPARVAREIGPADRAEAPELGS
jgi:maltose O-acetyltransferase